MNMEIKNLKAINEVFKRLNNLRRWANAINEGKYDEISKQALNCTVCYVLAVEAEERGTPVVWERFPKIALYRAFQKAYVNYDTPEHILKEICDLGGIQFKKAFGDVTDKTIEELTDENFTNWLREGCGTNEEAMYKAATQIATFIELKEIQRNINDDSYASKYEELVKSMARYEKIPAFQTVRNPENGYLKVFKEISKLRNQNRWAAYSYIVDCSVLGHLFDTAVFAYLMALEKGETETVATKCFFMGIFHDVPEAFTRDIPSPIKDKISGFRDLTEKYELLMMEKHVYPFISKESADKLRAIMFEDTDNAQYKKLMKGADYMSAISEIWRQLKAGSRDDSIVVSMNKHQEKFLSGKAEYTETTKELLEWMLKFANGLNLCSDDEIFD